MLGRKAEKEKKERENILCTYLATSIIHIRRYLHTLQSASRIFLQIYFSSYVIAFEISFSSYVAFEISFSSYVAFETVPMLV